MGEAKKPDLLLPGCFPGQWNYLVGKTGAYTEAPRYGKQEEDNEEGCSLHMKHPISLMGELTFMACLSCV